MIKFASFSLLCSLAALALSGCSSTTSPVTGSSGSPGSSGGSSGSGGSGGSGGSATGDYVIVPSATGYVDRLDVGNTVGIQGAWYPYGDQYGVAKCTNIGKHMGGQMAPPAECSIIDMPDAVTPNAPFAPTADGKMCTSGSTAMILPCAAGLTTSGCPAKDYANMWGAGIGFNLNQDKAPDAGLDAPKHPWSPDMYGVTGIAFDIDMVPLTKLRVEFAMQLPAGTMSASGTPILTTDDHPDGSPYWGATSAFPPSPVVAGHNTFKWADVKSPYESAAGAVPAATHYNFDRTQILAIQFHALAGSARGPYTFCVSNVTLLKE